MRLRRSYWVDTACQERVEVMECEQPGRVALAISGGGDLRRTWLTQEQFESLCSLRYEIQYAPPAEVEQEEKAE